MNIGFDIDGVLTDLSHFQLDIAREFFLKKYGRGIVNEAGYSIYDIYDASDKEFKEFWTRYIVPYSLRILARPGAKECVQNLIKEGNTIYIITSRIFADRNDLLGSMMRKAVLHWLKKEGISFEKIVFCNGSKIEAIKKFNIQVMVEDSPDNIKELINYTDIVCMDAKYNEYLSDPRIHRVTDFMGVYESIRAIRKKVRDKLDHVDVPLTGKMSVDQIYHKYYDDRQAHLFVPEMSIYEFIYDNNKDNLDALAIDYYNRKITFRSFFKKIEECAKALKASGVKRQDIVSICMPNTPEAIIMLYAVNKIGAVANMIHPLSSEEEIKHYLVETKSEFVLAIDMSVSKIQNIIADTLVRQVVVATPGNYMPLPQKEGYKILAFAKKHKLVELADRLADKTVKGLKLHRNSFKLVPSSVRKQMKSVSVAHYDETFISWQSFIASGRSYQDETLEHFAKNEMAFILHTGGSTGESKGVMLSNENVNANTIQLKYAMPPYEAGDKILAVTPIFHGFGLADCIHNAFGVSLSVILLPQFEMESYTQALLKHPFLVIGVPTLLDATIHLPELQNIDQPYDVFISGGAPLFKEKEEAANHFSRTHNGQYDTCKGGGMTETTAAFTFTMMGANKLESVGIPLPLNTVKIVDPKTGEELGPNEKGEICINGPSVMLGYYNDEEETSKALRKHADGMVWLHTGDIGYFDEDGLLYYSDRMKRMIITSGYNVYPQQIEKVIMMHPDVTDTVAVAIPDNRKGQVAKVFMVLRDGANEEKVVRELKLLCQKYLAKFSIPVAFETVASLPKTLYNKTDYRKLEAQEADKAKQKVMVNE